MLSGNGGHRKNDIIENTIVSTQRKENKTLVLIRKYHSLLIDGDEGVGICNLLIESKRLL